MVCAMTFRELGIETKRHIGEEKTLCPKCSHTRKKKKDPCLSVNHDTGLYHCFNCHWKGTINKFEPIMKTEPIVLPKLNRTNLSDKVFDWFFNERKISNNTLIRNQITEGIHFIPQEAKEMNCIWFNYFENGEHINTKFRTGNKKFTQVKSAKKTFYKIDDIKGFDWCIITEGEIDALSFEEAGIINAISVPDGAIKTENEYSDKKLQYIDNCIDYFQDIKKIYLATDTDEAGLCLRRELARRLGKEKCFIIEFNDCKDANEYLVKHGKESLAELIKTAKEYPIDGVHSAADYLEQLKDLYHNGFAEAIKIDQYQELNDFVVWYTPCLITVTGIPSHGKSSWLDQLMVRLLDHWKFAVYSPEHPTVMQLQRIARIIANQHFFGQNKMPEQTIVTITEWLKDKLYFITPQVEENNLDFVLLKAKELVSRYGVKALIIDNWGSLDEEFINETLHVKKSLSKLHFAKNNLEIAIFLVAHPVKMPKQSNGNFEVPTLYSINGSSYFYNKTDVGLVVYREDDCTKVFIQKVKFEGIYGKKGSVDFIYDTETCRYHELNNRDVKQTIQILMPDYSSQISTQKTEFPKGTESDFTDF
jgi:twinkle protein